MTQREKEERKKKKKKQEDLLFAMVMEMMEKSMAKALDAAIDDVLKGFK